MVAFFQSAVVLLRLATVAPLLVLTALFAVVLSWGWVLSDVDVFHLIWYNNAGVYFNDYGEDLSGAERWFLPKWRMALGGLATSIFWCIWVNTAKICLQKSSERQPWIIAPLPAYYKWWLLAIACLSVIPLILSNAPEYRTAGSPFEDRWPYLLGVLFGIACFQIGRQFAKPTPVLLGFFQMLPVTTNIFALLFLGSIGINALWPPRNESPVPVAMIWWALAIWIGAFESIGRSDAKDPKPALRWMIIIFVVIFVLSLIWMLTKYGLPSTNQPSAYWLWKLVIFFGFIASSAAITWIIHKPARTLEWQRRACRGLLSMAVAALCSVIVVSILDLPPILVVVWTITTKSALVTSIVFLLLAIVLASWIVPAPKRRNPLVVKTMLLNGIDGSNYSESVVLGITDPLTAFMAKFAVAPGAALPAGLAITPAGTIVWPTPAPGTHPLAVDESFNGVITNKYKFYLTIYRSTILDRIRLWLDRRWALITAPPRAQESWFESRSMFYAIAILYIILAYVNVLRDINNNSLYCFLDGNVPVYFLLGGITVSLAWLSFSSPTTRFFTVAGMIVIFAMCLGYQRFPHQLADLQGNSLRYYDLEPSTLPSNCPPVETNGDVETPNGHMPQLQYYHVYRKQKVAGQLDDLETLKQWKGPRERPPLVIVTVSGGATGSAMFTLKVLTALEARSKGFSKNVRIITGASGGMLGAAYFRTELATLQNYGGTQNDSNKLFREMNGHIQRDFLSPIMQEWVFKDLPIGLSPNSYSSDRGERLQQAWNKLLTPNLDKSFAELADQEGSGALPSLIFSPIMIEDGRQLLISTLDLNHLVIPDQLDVQPDESIRRLSAIELFKLFPKAYPQLRLSSAVRLNATFAWLNPSVTLPTIPSRSVVDAGYLDNHGILTAMMWIYQQRRWIVSNTSRVILLNIRVWDSFEEKRLPPITGPELDWINRHSAARWPRPVISFAELTTPLNGLENVRSYGSVYRNDRVTEGMQELLKYFKNSEEVKKKTEEFKGLEQYTIIGDIDNLPLNWTLSRFQASQLAQRVDLAMNLIKDGKVPIQPTSADEWNAREIYNLLQRIETP